MRSRPHKTKRRRRRRRLYKRRRRMRRKYSSGARRWRRGKNAARATKKAQARRRRSQELRAGKSKVSGWSRKTRRKKKRGGLRVGDRVKLSARGIEHYIGWVEHWDRTAPARAGADDYVRDALQRWRGVVRRGWASLPTDYKLVEWNPGAEGWWYDDILSRLAEDAFDPDGEGELEGGETTVVETEFLEDVKNPKSARKIPGTASTLSRRLLRRRAIPAHISEAAATVVRATGLQAGGLRRRKTKRRRRRTKRGGKTPSLGGNLVKPGMLAKVLCDSTEAAAVVGCEVIGLGPEDPLADICAWKLAMALSKGCKTFASEEQEVLVSEGKNIITMPLKIVKKHFSKKHKRKRGRKKYKRRISGVEI